MNKDMKLLEKFLTRDAPLVALENWWYKGFAVDFEIFLAFHIQKLSSCQTMAHFQHIVITKH